MLIEDEKIGKAGSTLYCFDKYFVYDIGAEAYEFISKRECIFFSKMGRIRRLSIKQGAFWSVLNFCRIVARTLIFGRSSVSMYRFFIGVLGYIIVLVCVF